MPEKKKPEHLELIRKVVTDGNARYININRLLDDEIQNVKVLKVKLPKHGLVLLVKPI